MEIVLKDSSEWELNFAIKKLARYFIRHLQKDLRMREFYLKPGERRRLKEREARKRLMRKVKKYGEEAA